MDLNAISGSVPSSSGVSTRNSFADLGSADFLKLLITQLTNQDPLEPTGNEELLRQISSIREIELSTAMSDSLLSLTGQQRFASASAMIGQYVSGVSADSGEMTDGLVMGVRFNSDGAAVLQLASGNEMALEDVSTIQSPLSAAEKLIGQTIVGVDTRETDELQIVEGLVTAARVDERGEVLLELDSGQDLRFRDLGRSVALTA